MADINSNSNININIDVSGLDAVKEQMKNLSEETAKGADNIKKYNTAAIELTDIQKKQITDQVNLSNAKKQYKDQVMAETSAYKALSVEYTTALQKAKDLAASEGLQSQATLEATANAKKLNDQLKAIDASIGNNQRNVGNYKDALGETGEVSGRAFGKFFRGTVEAAAGATLLFGNSSKGAAELQKKLNESIGVIYAMKGAFEAIHAVPKMIETIKTSIGALTSPIGLVIAGIAALSVAVYEMYENWTNTSDAVDTFNTAIDNIAIDGLKAFNTTLDETNKKLKLATLEQEYLNGDLTKSAYDASVAKLKIDEDFTKTTYDNHLKAIQLEQQVDKAAADAKNKIITGYNKAVVMGTELITQNTKENAAAIKKIDETAAATKMVIKKKLQEADALTSKEDLIEYENINQKKLNDDKKTGDKIKEVKEAVYTADEKYINLLKLTILQINDTSSVQSKYYQSLIDYSNEKIKLDDQVIKKIITQAEADDLLSIALLKVKNLQDSYNETFKKSSIIIEERTKYTDKLTEKEKDWTKSIDLTTYSLKELWETFKTEPDLADKAFDLLIKKAEDIADNIGKIGGGVGKIFETAYESAQIKSDNFYGAEYDKLEQLHDKKIISDTDYDNKKKELDKKQQQENRVIKTKEARLNKEEKMFDIAISTSKAIMEAAPNPFLMTAMGILGGVEEAFVAAQPIPKYATGGMINVGTTGTADDVPIMASRGEFVVNASAASKNLPLLNNINGGGSSDFAKEIAYHIGRSIQSIPVINVATDTQKVNNKVNRIKNVSYLK